MRKLAFLVVAAIALPHRAMAQTPPACDTLPNPIYLRVGDTQTNLMKRLGRALRDNKLPDTTPNPITLVFVTGPSCANIAEIYNSTPITVNFSYIQSVADDATLGTWTPATAPLICTPPTGGKVPQIANSAVFNTACPTFAPSASVNITVGPKQAYVLAVPTISTPTAITFEEAYFVFGFGTAGMITPWVDEAQMFIRKPTASTVIAWAKNISVPETRWKGLTEHGNPPVANGSPDVVAGVNAGTGATIGILGAEVYDSNRATMKALAFRAKGQYAAYYPDSSSSARDKKNVRDGHYTVWSPTIWMDSVVSGTAVNATARYVIDLIAGKTVTPAPSFSVIDIVAAVGAIPECAMGVSREFEGGPLSLFRPTESCSCKFESLVATTSCATCTTTCTTGVCRNGFCEDH